MENDLNRKNDYQADKNNDGALSYLSRIYIQSDFDNIEKPVQHKNKPWIDSSMIMDENHDEDKMEEIEHIRYYEQKCNKEN